MFDNISSEDLIMAFFPCIYFCENNRLYFRGEHLALKKFNNLEKIDRILDREDKRCLFYKLLLKLFYVCENKCLKLIVENPYSELHYLYDNFLYRPAVIDKDRTIRGDYLRKPTQFWFLNFQPTCGASWQPQREIKTVQSLSGWKNNKGLYSEERSMISPDYARNFICDFILGKPQKMLQKTIFEID